REGRWVVPDVLPPGDFRRGDRYLAGGGQRGYSAPGYRGEGAQGGAARRRLHAAARADAAHAAAAVPGRAVGAAVERVDVVHAAHCELSVRRPEPALPRAERSGALPGGGGAVGAAARAD